MYRRFSRLWKCALKIKIVTFLKFARILLGDNTGGGEVNWSCSSEMKSGFQLDCFVHSFAIDHTMYSQDLRKIRLAPNLPERTYGERRMCLYTLSNKNLSAWNFLSPAQAVTWRTVVIIIRVVLLSPYLRIRGVSLSSINPEVSGGRIPLQDKYCHKSEPHWDYVEWGEKDNAGNPACSPSQK